MQAPPASPVHVTGRNILGQDTSATFPAIAPARIHARRLAMIGGPGAAVTVTLDGALLARYHYAGEGVLPLVSHAAGVSL